MKGEVLSIGAVARTAGISSSAVRYYESIGVLPPPGRLNGRRVYDESIFAYLAAIRLARESGFSVSEMKELLESCTEPVAERANGRKPAGRAGATAGTGRWKSLARAKIDELDRTIEKASAMKRLLHQWLECECVSLEDCELIAARLELRAPSALNRDGRKDG